MAGCAQEPYPYPDIVAALDSRQKVIIDQMYSGQITQAEAQARMDEARMVAISEEQRRNYQNRPMPMRLPMYGTHDLGMSVCY